METVTDFIFLASKISAAMVPPAMKLIKSIIIKSRDILPINVRRVKAMVFPDVMYG